MSTDSMTALDAYIFWHCVLKPNKQYTDTKHTKVSLRQPFDRCYTTMLERRRLSLTLTMMILISTLDISATKLNHVALYQLDSAQENRLAKGRETLYDLQRRTLGESSLSVCWSDAVSALADGCRSMTDDDRSKFAVHLTNCHLQRSGLTTYPCTHEMSLLQCTSAMGRDPIAFNAYTEFMLHADNICFFLQHEYFLARTEHTISNLARSAEEMVSVLDGLTHLEAITSTMTNSLEASVQIQRQVLHSQASLETSMAKMEQTQEQHLQHVSAQFEELSSLSDTIKRGVEDTAHAQQELIHGQARLGDQQERLHNEGKAFLERLTQNGDLLQHKIESSLATQHQIQEVQQTVVSNLEGLTEHQNKLHTIQEHFYLQQSKMHDYTKQSLGDIIQTSNQANGQLRTLVESQSENFRATLQNMNDMAVRSENTIAKIHEHHEEISKIQAELFNSIDMIQDFQTAVMGEFFDIKAVFYYASFLILTFLLTASSRTGSARLYLLILLVANLLMERILFSLQLEIAAFTPIEQVWLLRKGFIVTACIAWFVACIRHNDYQKQNNELLQRIAQLNDEILQHQRYQEELWHEAIVQQQHSKK